MSLQQNYATLSAEEMSGIALTFQESIQHTLSSFLNSEFMPNIIQYLASLATSYQPVRAASKDGRQRLVDEIFGTAYLADFFTRLTSVFYSRLGSNEEINGMIGNIARGASLHIPENQAGNNPGDPVKYGLVPKELTMRFSSTSELIEVLSANAWMVSVLCVCLYINPTQLQRTKA